MPTQSLRNKTLKIQRHLHTQKTKFSKTCYLKWQPTLRVGGKWIFNVTNLKDRTHPGNRRADPCPGFPTNFPRNWSTTITINTRGSKRWGLCWLLNSSSCFWVLQVIGLIGLFRFDGTSFKYYLIVKKGPGLATACSKFRIICKFLGKQNNRD